MNQMAKIVLVALLAVVVASCAGRKKMQENPNVSAESGEGVGIMTGIDPEIQVFMDNNGIVDSGRYNLSDPLSNKTIYFEYDSSTLDAESDMIVQFHAQHLASTNGSVVLEGHADERGSREYNLSLGERRGQTVQSVMSAIGASNSEVVSYGEEKPISEEFWQNRRVELLY
jgi:peptidoglycan-associated lipoprotein